MKVTLELDLDLSIQDIESDGDIYKITVEKYNKENVYVFVGNLKV